MTRFSVYVGRQILVWWAVCLSGVILIFLSTQLLRITPLFAGTQLELGEMLTALGLVCLPIAAWSLTPALIIAVFATAGRMAADLELTATDALGIPRRHLIIGPIGITVVGTLLSAWLWFEAAPQSVSRLRRLAAELAGRAVVGRVEPNRFVQLIEGLTIYTDKLGPDRSLLGVFVEDARSGDRSVQFIAEQAVIALRSTERTLKIRLGRGSAFIVPSIENDRPVAFTFESFIVEIPLEQSIEEQLDFLPHSLGVLTQDLFGKPQGGVAEGVWRYALWRRVAGPLGFLSLTLLAIFLAFGQSQQLSQGAALVLAFLIFLVYHLSTRFLETLVQADRLDALSAALLPGMLTILVVFVVVLGSRFRKI